MNKNVIKWITNCTVFWLIGFFLWNGVIQLYVSTFIWNMKNYDFIEIDNKDKLPEPVVIKQFIDSQTSSWITNSWSSSTWIVSLWNKTDVNQDNSLSDLNVSSIDTKDLKDIYKNYNISIPQDSPTQVINKWGYFVDRFNKDWITNMDSEYLTMNDWDTYPITQSIWADLPLAKIWFTYFNSDMLYLNANQKAYTLYAHSNYWKGGNYIWEKLLKWNEWDTFSINWNNFKVLSINSVWNDDSLTWILTNYINSKADVLLYTCETHWTKRFIIAKKIN